IVYNISRISNIIINGKMYVIILVIINVCIFFYKFNPSMSQYP
ncbi:unnamed protein product, partial [marine sediment metagenome]